MKLTKVLITTALLFTTAASQAGYYGHYERLYKVTITNITKNVIFTPVLVATHSTKADVFEVGETASDELANVAESGNIAPLMSALSASAEVTGTEGADGLLMAGETVEIVISGLRSDVLSLTAMLLPTNDTFVGLDSVRLPRRGPVTYFARAYDAGSETNNELCVSIPGPQCGGEPLSIDDNGEGYIFPSPALHGEGDLSLATYNWQGAVAKVVISRINH